MTLLIVEAFELVDLPVPDATPSDDGMPSEMDRKVAYWTNHLAAAVPFEELRPAFDFAANRHADPRRPVNPIDVKLAYPDMLAERERKRRAEPSEDAGPEAKTCTFCDEEQMCQIWVPAAGVNVTAPCRDCRPKAFEQYMADWHRKNGAKQEPVSLSLVRQAGDRLTLICDSCREKVVEAYPQERPCKRLLNMAEGDEGAPTLCKGTLRRAHRAECVNEECGGFRVPRLVIVGSACACGSAMAAA